MKFPVAIEMGNGFNAYGAAVPDLPGCFGAGDNLDSTLADVKREISAHCERLAAGGGRPPIPRPMEGWQRTPAFAGWLWSAVDVTVEPMFAAAPPPSAWRT